MTMNIKERRKVFVTTLSLVLMLVLAFVFAGEESFGASVKLSKGKKTMQAGTSFVLTLKGAGKASAKSGDKSIAKVKKKSRNSWTVTGVARGKTTITVKYKGKKYKCKVKVKPYKIDRSSLVDFAHRGYAERYPEESAIALRKACEAGFDGLSFDIWPTKKDGKGNYDFAVSHDNELSSMTDSKSLVTKTTAQKIVKLKITKGANAKKYKQKMILLDTAMKIAKKHKKPAQIELKGKWTRAQTDLFVKKLVASGMAEMCQIEGHESSTLRNFNKSQKAAGLALDTLYVSRKGENAFKRTNECVKYGFTHLQVNHHKVTKKLVNYCKKKGIGIGTYVEIGYDANRAVHRLQKYDLQWFVISEKA